MAKVINNLKALSFLNTEAPPQTKKVSKASTIENQINKGMQNACHEYLLKEWGQYYKMISTDYFKVDRKKVNGETIETKDDTPIALNGEYRVILPTDNGTTVKGEKVGKCFRLGHQQTYLQGVQTEACCYYTVDGITYFYDEKGNIINGKN